MKSFTYFTKGVCSRKINIRIENGVLMDVAFEAGCNGNLQGISKLVQGMNIDDVINKLNGIDCRGKGTSCPDQLSKALQCIKNNESDDCGSNNFESNNYNNSNNDVGVKELQLNTR